MQCNTVAWSVQWTLHVPMVFTVPHIPLQLPNWQQLQHVAYDARLARVPAVRLICVTQEWSAMGQLSEQPRQWSACAPIPLNVPSTVCTCTSVPQYNGASLYLQVQL